MNRIFSDDGMPSSRLDLLFLCALSAKLPTMVSDCCVAVSSVPTSQLPIIPKPNIVADLFHFSSFKGKVPDVLPAPGETPLSDHSQLTVSYSP